MTVSILPASPDRPREDRVRAAVAALERGGLVALPTETFYGIATDSGNPRSLRRLQELKGVHGAPILLLLADARQVEQVAGTLGDAFHRIARKFWPGPLTLVVPASPDLDPAITAGTGTVGIRMPGIVLPRRVAAALGRPITGTSANRHGEPAARTAAEVVRGLPDGIDLLLDGGPTPGGASSTILDLASKTPRVLREGAVPVSALKPFLPEIDPATV